MSNANKDYCGEISIKTVPFTGRDSYWPKWSVKAIALARKKGWYPAWIEDYTNPGEGEREKAKKAREKMNNKGYHWLLLSATGKAFYLLESVD
jgi:hypothetical protein